jgi:hypothetical protein
MKPMNFSICLTIFCSMVIGAFLINTAGAELGAKTEGPVRVSSLTEPFNPTETQRKDLERLRGQLGQAPTTSIAASVEIPDARPVPLPDGLGTAWVASAPDGGVCTFIPDPIGGYGSSCASQADLRAGGSITVLGGAGELNDQAVAVLVVPDGGPTPVVTAPDGTETLEPVPGVGATLIPEESRLRIGGVSLRVPSADAR